MRLEVRGRSHAGRREFVTVYIVTAMGTECIMRGFNPRLASEEPDLGPPLTINVMVWWVALEPRTPPS